MDTLGSTCVEVIREELTLLPCYTEVRLEARRETLIESIGDDTILEVREDQGGYVRALLGGMWRFDSFSGFSPAIRRLRGIASYSRQWGGPVGEPSATQSSFPRVAVLNSDHRGFDCPQHLAGLLTHYLELAFSQPQVVLTQVRFFDVSLRSLFLNSMGALIEQERHFFGAFFAIVAAGDEPQSAMMGLAGTDSRSLEGQEERVLDVARRAVARTKAKPVRTGTYTVVLDPCMTGTFIHEGFGHLREADNPSAGLGSSLCDCRVGPETLNIVDDGSLLCMLGGYAYDDEGEPSSKTYLVQNGRLAGRLHSQETARFWQEKPTGNARTASYRYPPIPRMSCTYMEPGDTDVEGLFEGIREGVFVRGARGGSTNGQVFVFSAEEAYMIRGGQIAEPVRDVVLTGEVFATLRSIEAIGKDFQWAEATGCTKAKQFLPTISWGGPHLRVANVTVGGL